MYRRANARWTVNECLRLEREFDLLKLSIEEIAALHGRSTNAIMYKLDAEGIADYNDVFQNRQQKLKVEEQVEEDASVSEYEEDASVSEYEEEQEEQEEQEDASVSEYEEEQEEYDSYNVRQQIRSLTKQVANLTAIVYNAFTTKNNSNRFKGQSLAGFH